MQRKKSPDQTLSLQQTTRPGRRERGVWRWQPCARAVGACATPVLECAGAHWGMDTGAGVRAPSSAPGFPGPTSWSLGCHTHLGG